MISWGFTICAGFCFRQIFSSRRNKLCVNVGHAGKLYSPLVSKFSPCCLEGFDLETCISDQLIFLATIVFQLVGSASG